MPGRQGRSGAGHVRELRTEVTEMDDKDPFYGWRFVLWLCIGGAVGLVILRSVFH